MKAGVDWRDPSEKTTCGVGIQWVPTICQALFWVLGKQRWEGSILRVDSQEEGTELERNTQWESDKYVVNYIG